MTSETSNFEFLVEYISARVTEWLARDEGLEVAQAMLRFHNSETFEILSRPETGMYIESPAFVYEIFREESRKGTLRGLTE